MRKPASWGDGLSAADYVEVYDEPDHAPLLDNPYVYAYRVRLSPAQATLWHRHTEDTVYFSLAAGRGHEQQADSAIVTEIPCARAVLRPHRSDPLIHKVTNIGEGRFHLVGAEAHARPPAPDASTLQQAGHEIVLETDRFLVARVRLDCDARPYAASGLLLALAEGGVRSGDAAAPLAAGAVRWIEANECAAPCAGFDGFFAAWR